jgi:nucleotide-binding universal stress UspA family protein
MSIANQARILVGASGSAASLRALRWAARQASERQARLDVVLTWQQKQGAYYAVESDYRVRGAQCDAAKNQLATIVLAVFGSATPAHVTAELVEGPAERVLADRSAGASLLVLGSTSSPALRGRSVGPVIRSCLSRAHCPVVVVGPEQAAGNSRQREPVAA